MINQTYYELTTNAAKLRIFLRHQVLSYTYTTDVLAECLKRHFPDSEIVTKNGISWSVNFLDPNVDTSDIILYESKVHSVLIDFFNNDIVRGKIRESISEDDKSVFYDLFYKFNNNFVSPIMLTTMSIVPDNSINKAKLIIEF